MDKFCGKLYEDYGAKVKYGVKCAEQCDLITFKEHVWQIYFDKKTKDIKKINILKLSKLYNIQ